MKLEITEGSNDAHFKFKLYEPGCSPGYETVFSGTAKWDGCVDIWRGDPNSVPDGQDDPDYMHLCDSGKELIDLLVKVREEGKRRWSKGHPGEWKD